jgi:Zn-dependent peptidase ImmA (M78 family)/transcriptional regulator with XRE-family HTH domain
MPDNFNPEMLILARESRGLTQNELAGQLSVFQGTVSKLEAGMLQPSEDLLRLMADRLKYSEHFFQQTDRVYGLNSTVFFHRKRQSVPDKVMRRLHAQMNITRMRVRRMLRSVDLEHGNRFQEIRPEEHKGDVVTIARMVRSNWLLPPGPVRNVTKTIEDAGGFVIKMDFGIRQADAVSEWVDGSPPIFLVNSNADISGDRYRLTLAHEVAHIFMHRDFDPNMETEANQFMAEFLMPRREIKSALFNLNMAKLAELKRYWKVSMQALVHRAYELKTITENQRRYLYINITKRTGSRIHEPLESEMPIEQPGLFNRLVQIHLGKLGYSTTQFAKMLFFADDSEFRSQVFGEKRLMLV